MNWHRDGPVVWKPVRALLFADKKVFFWVKGKFELSGYNMAALAWLKGLILGLLLGWWLLWLESGRQAFKHRLNLGGDILLF